MNSLIRNMSIFFLFFYQAFIFSFSRDVLIKPIAHNIDLKKIFVEKKLSFGRSKVVTDPYVLQSAAKEALKFFKYKNSFSDTEKSKNVAVTRPKIFNSHIIRSKDVEKTLEFIIKTIDQDKKSKNFRILNSNFFNSKNFRFIRWFGRKNYLGQRNKYIRLTKYAIFKTRGSYEKTQNYSYPLYAIQDASFSSFLRFKFSKQEILSGILDSSEFRNKVKPIVWLTRNGLEEALMQGSIVVRMPDGKEQIFNVDKSNGMGYSKKLGGKRFQKRYWYFKRVKNIDDEKQSLKIIKHGGAAFAGDLYSIGLGKIIAIKYKNPLIKKDEIRLGVLSDVGSALTNNLEQLDYFTGVFNSKKKFKDYIKNIPPYVECYILVKR